VPLRSLMSTQVSGVMFRWNTYDFTKATAEGLRRLKKTALRGGADWVQEGRQTWLSKPSGLELIKFINYVGDIKLTTELASIDKEDILMKTEGKVDWEGTCLWLGEKQIEMCPVPYEVRTPLVPAEKAVIGVLSMAVASVSSQELTPSQDMMSLSKSVLGNVVDTKGMTDFMCEMEQKMTKEMPPVADDLVGHKIASWYVAKPRRERLEIAQKMYLGMFKKTFVKVTGGMQVSSLVESEVKSYTIGRGSEVERFDLPSSVKIVGNMDVRHKTKIGKKEDVTTEIQALVSCFPPRLRKYHGFRGTPGKCERRMLSLMTIAKEQPGRFHVYAPNDQEEKWLKLNNVPYVLDREEVSEVLIVSESNFKKAERWINKGHLVYGTLPIMEALAKGWKAVTYRMQANMAFYWYKGEHVWSPRRYGYGLKACSDASHFKTAYQNWVVILTESFIMGDYRPKDQWYKELKYPDLTTSLNVVKIVPERVDLDIPYEEKKKEKVTGFRTVLVDKTVELEEEPFPQKKILAIRAEVTPEKEEIPGKGKEVPVAVEEKVRRRKPEQSPEAILASLGRRARDEEYDYLFDYVDVPDSATCWVLPDQYTKNSREVKLEGREFEALDLSTCTVYLVGGELWALAEAFTVVPLPEGTVVSTSSVLLDDDD